MAHINRQDALPLGFVPRRRPPFDPHQGLVEVPCTRPDSLTESASMEASQMEPSVRLPLVLPALRTEEPGTHDVMVSFIQPDNMAEYFQNDLEMGVFDDIHKYLWLASGWVVVEALNEQIRLFDSVAITEIAIQHLVYKDHRLYIKPLPEYLLCHSVWESYLCPSNQLYACALGFLRSYFYLVRSKSDLKLAQQNLLLPAEITWEQWTAFSRAAFPNCSHDACNPRFWYGVLSARSLTWIARLCPETRSFHQFRGQWMPFYWSPSRYMQESTKWLLGSLFYITIVLTAMQTGLATNMLQWDDRFQKASSGFVVFSILAPLAALFAVLATALFRLFNEVWMALQQRQINSDRSAD